MNNQYYFDWGDGTLDTLIWPNAPHTYATTGTFYVMAIADKPGTTCPQDTTYDTVIVVASPIANFVLNPVSPCFGGTTDLNDSSFLNGAGSTITSWQWVINERDTLTSQNLNYTFLMTGEQYISLEATTNNGCKSSFSDTINIVNDTALANFSWPSVNCPCNEIPFSGSGTAVSYSWNFGDGNTASGINSNHTFSAPGLYSVALTGTSASGCKYTKNVPVTSVQTIPLEQ